MTASPYTSALVTGASRGIGAAVCRKLASVGLRVYGVARSGDALDRLAAECGVVPIVADIRDAAAILAALAGSPVDVLVNNAGAISSVRPLHEQGAQEIADTVAVNLTAPLQLTALLLPGMIERRRGHVITLTSTAGSSVFPGTAAYGAAKAGLSQAGRVLRFDLAGSNVRFTEVMPGRVQTEVYLEAFSGDRARLDATMYASVRALQPSDIADTVASAILLPEHVDVAVMEVLPTDQASGGAIFRTPNL